jgi:hypothetical protein
VAYKEVSYLLKLSHPNVVNTISIKFISMLDKNLKDHILLQGRLKEIFETIENVYLVSELLIGGEVLDR